MPTPAPKTAVELRLTHGPTRTMRVTEAQWEGRACIVGTNCTGDQLENVGDLCDTSTAPGSLGYLRSAYAHPECRGLVERRPKLGLGGAGTVRAAE
ncbi:hypothetical protein [Streptomyces sp. Y1]|uniref:Uncharacterized protein n=1 Tax=Streptomyces sp. Y1 TaxID=3238634 RepID=A0AB39TJT1_9ACTN